MNLLNITQPLPQTTTRPQLCLVDNNSALKQQLCDEMVAQGCMQSGADITENESGFWRFADAEDSQGQTAGWCSPFYGDNGTLLAATFGTHRDEGNNHQWKSSGFTSLSDEERVEVEQRIQTRRLEQEVERAENQTRSRQNLMSILESCSPISEHPYLNAKGINGHGALEGANDELYIPLSDIDGNLITAQRIQPDGTKRLWSGCGKKSAMLKIVGDSRVMLIAEGYATAATLFDATGYTSIMAIDAGNLIHVARDVQQAYPNTVVVICGDNDQFGEKNTGLEKCQQIKAQLRIPFVLPQFTELATKPTDFNDLAHLAGVEEVKRQLEPVIEQARLGLPAGFSHSINGVYYEQSDKEGNTRNHWVCSPLKITALTRDVGSESWGKLIELTNADGITHTFAMPNTMLTALASEYLKPLVDKGLSYSHQHRDHLHHYLAHAKPVNRARCIDKTGWFNGSFVLPQEVIGESTETIVFQSNATTPKGFEQQGTLDEWKENVASLCVGNSRLAFAVSTAFATALLPMVDGESGGFHFRCGSSRGKTTILMVAKSVWGSPESLPRWRATANGLEGLATLHNHSLLCLDEFSQLAEVSPKVAGEAIYMLGNGEGKQRSRKDGSLANRYTWQLLYLSAGEVSLRATLEQAGIPVRAGQEVRFIDLPADAGRNLGVFDTVHEYADGNRFALAIKENANRYYGVAAREFIHRIAMNYQEHQGWLFDKTTEFTSALALTDADPQVLRVAQRFAIVAAAGELATSLGITGWAEGTAIQSSLACFNAWLEQRGGTESHEETQAIEAVRSRLLENESARFIVDTFSPPGVTWGMKTQNGFYVYSSAFKNNICDGLDPKFVAQTLAQKGFLEQKDNRNTVTKRIGQNTVRCYHILSALFNESELDVSSVELEVSEDAQTTEPTKCADFEKYSV